MPKQCPLLYKIKLENNQIDNIDKLKCLANYEVKKINLKGNPLVEKNPDYKKELFELIPTLIAVDGTNKDGEVVESTLYGGEDEEGEYFVGEDGEIDDDISGEEYVGR